MLFFIKYHHFLYLIFVLKFNSLIIVKIGFKIVINIKIKVNLISLLFDSSLGNYFRNSFKIYVLYR
jgi:hypothetical protein